MDFEFLGEITDVESIAAGREIRDLPRLRRLYGKGKAARGSDCGTVAVRLAELH